MNHLLLAQSAPLTFQPPRGFPSQGELLHWCQNMEAGIAILFMLIGIVYLLYGFTWFKALITLNAALIGAGVGAALGAKAGGYTLLGAILGAAVCGAVTYPLMKWAVAVVGGMCGAVVGGSIWLTLGQDPQFAWAGAMTGLVGFGLFAFILFRGSLIMYTSLQGSLMLILGLLGLVLKYPAATPSITNIALGQPMMLPLAILAAAIIGLLYQQKHTGESPKTEIRNPS